MRGEGEGVCGGGVLLLLLRWRLRVLRRRRWRRRRRRISVGEALEREQGTVVSAARLRGDEDAAAAAGAVVEDERGLRKSCLGEGAGGEAEQQGKVGGRPLQHVQWASMQFARRVAEDGIVAGLDGQDRVRGARRHGDVVHRGKVSRAEIPRLVRSVAWQSINSRNGERKKQ